MEVQSNENTVNMKVDSNENTMEIEVIDRAKRRDNKFNKFQHDVKKEGEGKGKLAREVKSDYDQAKKKNAEERVVEQKKVSYRLICDVNHFVKFLDEIPQMNKHKLGDSPFAHFLNLKNKNLQLNQVGITLSLYLGDNLKLQLLTEEMEVTKEDFSALMGIADMDPISDDNQNIADSIVQKFCDKKSEGISMSKVKEVLRNVKEDENDIKRAFAIMAMHYIVCPPKRSTHATNMLRFVNNVNEIKRQRWASMALEFLHNGRYNGTAKTKVIGGCVFFLQLYLMRKQDKELDLFKIDEEQIKKFRLKWEQDYGHESALKGYSQPLVNKVVREMEELRETLVDKKNPINLRYLMDFDKSLAKFKSDAAARKRALDESEKISEEDTTAILDSPETLQDTNAPPDESGNILQENAPPAQENQQDVSRSVQENAQKKNVTKRGKKTQNVSDRRVTRNQSRQQGFLHL